MFCFFSLVFRMVEAEEEYTEQLEILISCFLRPFKVKKNLALNVWKWLQMAASSKNPPCCHEDLNSIFLNAETVLFLHQVQPSIFIKSWVSNFSMTSLNSD